MQGSDLVDTDTGADAGSTANPVQMLESLFRSGGEFHKEHAKTVLKDYKDILGKQQQKTSGRKKPRDSGGSISLTSSLENHLSNVKVLFDKDPAEWAGMGGFFAFYAAMNPIKSFERLMRTEGGSGTLEGGLESYVE